MARAVTLFTGQWADLTLEELCRKAADFGFDGLELACWGDHFEVDKALSDDTYCARKRELLEKRVHKVDLRGQDVFEWLQISSVDCPLLLHEASSDPF